MAQVDKGYSESDNRNMKPTNRELWQQKTQSADKDAHAIIARDFSASRMNATKWRTTIKSLADLGLHYRLRWVDVPDVSVWMHLWIPYPNSTYFDSGPVGPFKTFTIEWLEVDSYHQWGSSGCIHEQDQTTEVERRLQEKNIPYHWEDQYLRIVGHVRNR